MSCGLPGSNCKDNTTRVKNKHGRSWIRFGIGGGKNRDRSVEKKDRAQNPFDSAPGDTG